MVGTLLKPGVTLSRYLHLHSNILLNGVRLLVELIEAEAHYDMYLGGSDTLLRETIA